MIEAFTFAQGFWPTIGVAILCGGIVGFERQLRGKAAGIRTSMLVCLGTAVFVHFGSVVATPTGDPARVLGQLITGVGFLGAGVMFANQGVVTGVTTAAVIWMLAGIGAAVGFGYRGEAFALSLVTVSILVGVEFLESSLKSFARGVHTRKPDAPAE